MSQPNSIQSEAPGTVLSLLTPSFPSGVGPRSTAAVFERVN